MKIGDRVVICEHSEYYNEGEDNPDNSVLGTIFRIYLESSTPFCYEVYWDNGVSNDYRPEDLVLVSRRREVRNLTGFAKWHKDKVDASVSTG